MRLELPCLRPGDRVAVVAPSSPVRAEMLDEGLAQVRSLGLDPLVREDILARHRFTAGDEDRRLRELCDAMVEPSVRAVFVARGGSGATALLPALQRTLSPVSPRPILGESDATALGCWALCQGIGWLHGPMVAGSLRLGAEGADEASLRAALFDASGELAPAGTRAIAGGEAEGVVWGGCLSLLASLCGTPFMPRFKSSLLLVEDTGVKPYQVHRMLVQLRDAGALEGVRGVMLGDFSDCVQHAEQDYDVVDVMAELFVSAIGRVPISAGWPVGHAKAPHLTVPMGVEARLRVAADDRPVLQWHR